MKPVLFRFAFTDKELMRFEVDHIPHFYDKLHLHPELQITLVLKSEGTFIAGDYIGSFKPGDIFIIGSNLPHILRNGERYFKGEKNLHAESLALYLNEQSFRDHFLNYKEMEPFKKFLERAKHGLKVEGETKKLLTTQMWKMKTATGPDRFILLFEILKLLSESKTTKVLNKHLNREVYTEKEGKRMMDVFQFTFKESHRAISVNEVAAIANMSTTAFCRYFKTHTRKTYIEFLNEIRINNACMLLQKDDASVTQVCYQVGFNNLSNFNRAFKKIMKKTPMEYREVRE
jgi:AraC-like DNA-binding protein